MKLTRKNLAVWSLGALLLAACSSGGGDKTPTPPPPPSSSLTITTTDAVGVPSTYTADASNSIITAHKNAIENKTIIQICSDLDRDNDCSVLIIMTLDGTTAQTYSMAAPGALTQIVYHDDETETGLISHYLSSGGEVVVTESGSAAGEWVRGSFTSDLTCNAGCAGNIALSGTFALALSQ